LKLVELYDKVLFSLHELSVPVLKTKVTVNTKYCRVADLYNATKYFPI